MSSKHQLEGDRRTTLSPMQQGMLYHALTFPAHGYNIEQIHFTLHEAIDIDRFQASWRWLLARHPALRHTIDWQGVDVPEQVVGPICLDFRRVDSSPMSFDVGQLLETDRQEGFDLGRGPLSRVHVVRLHETHYEVVWSFHHILFDGRSFPLLLTELFKHYEGQDLEDATPELLEEHLAFLAERAADPESRKFWQERTAAITHPTPLPLRQKPGYDPSVPPTPLTPTEAVARLSSSATTSLKALANEQRVGFSTLIHAAWAIALGRFTERAEVVFGATRACRHGGVPGARDAVGVFINTLPVGAEINAERTLRELLQQLRQSELATREHEYFPLVEVQNLSALPAGASVFETNIVFDNFLLGARLRDLGGSWAQRDFVLHESPPFALTLYGNLDPDLLLRLSFAASRFSGKDAQWLLEAVAAVLEELAEANGLDRTIGSVNLLRRSRAGEVLELWNRTQKDVPEGTLPAAFETRARSTPDAIALIDGDRSLTYAELEESAERIAASLERSGLSGNAIVGLCAARSCELVIGALAILKAGGAYLPLDPAYPAERLELMLEDSGATIVLGDCHAASLARGTKIACLDVRTELTRETEEPTTTTRRSPAPSDLAYVIYTSGSTGRPKGVMVEHRNVLNFFAAMDDRIPDHEDRVWLAVTSLSFDISVLEIFWTLCRGTRVVLGAELGAKPALRAGPAFSLFYFAAGAGEDNEPYRLLLDGARFADDNDFEAVWLPERHFHDFGGLYPNPSVAAAAVAARTRKVAIRAGSVVSPLHHPARIAEEWAMVDNLSGGRVGLSFASGWHPNDFVLRPEGYDDRRAGVLRDLESVRSLWRGEQVSFPGPTSEVRVRTLPKPVQAELPVWLTTAGNRETYIQAGNAGANVLTHLLGQTLQEVSENLAEYRRAWREAGHPGNGHATLMLHAFLGEARESVLRTVRDPMKNYLRSSLGLIRGFASQWSAFKRGAGGGEARETVPQELSLEQLSEEEMDALLDYSFERYSQTSALFGTVDEAAARVEQLVEHGVDEIACLVDFGVPTQVVLDHLPFLAELRLRSQTSDAPPALSELIRSHQVTHLQCTPSLARLLLLEEDSRSALGQLETLLVGGEALPPQLACDLQRSTGRVLNMYGPTETTIWSTVHELEPNPDSEMRPVPIGRPIANTSAFVLDETLRPVPPGVIGELFLGGKGVVRGYWQRPGLTEERFIPARQLEWLSDHADSDSLYRTGDLVHWDGNGVLHYDGRADFQVKLRGHRIELGEIESLLTQDESVHDAVVLLREDRPDDQRLVAYVTPAGSSPPEERTLRQIARRTLPEFMVPARIVVLEALPLTPNGKLDRAALPVPESTVAADPAETATEVEAVKTRPETGSSAIRNDAEDVARRRVVEIWSRILARDDVDLDSNFFDLGGHSLLAVRAHRELKQEFGEGLQITDLFRFPTAKTLAAHIASQGAPNQSAQAQAGVSADLEETAGAISDSQRRAELRRRRRRGGAQ